MSVEPAKLPGRAGGASAAGQRLLPSPSGPSYLDRVSLKIVFNGAEYDSVEAMPPDVRAQYEQVLETLKQTGGDEVLSALQRASSGGATFKATYRQIVVDGKKYGSVDEMPADVRRTYEQAVGHLGAGAGPGGPPTSVRPPPLVEDDQRQRGGILRILLWMALGAAIALWLVRRG